MSIHKKKKQKLRKKSERHQTQWNVSDRNEFEAYHLPDFGFCSDYYHVCQQERKKLKWFFEHNLKMFNIRRQVWTQIVTSSH